MSPIRTSRRSARACGPSARCASTRPDASWSRRIGQRPARRPRRCRAVPRARRHRLRRRAACASGVDCRRRSSRRATATRAFMRAKIATARHFADHCLTRARGPHRDHRFRLDGGSCACRRGVLTIGSDNGRDNPVTPRQEIAAPTVLFVPGVRDHVPEHWQTLLEQKLPKATCVPRMERDKLSCAAWVANARPVARADRGTGRAGRAQRRRHDRRALGAAASSARSRAHCSRHRPISNRRSLPVIPTLETLQGERLAADTAHPLAVSQHRRGEHKRSARDASIASRRSHAHGAVALSTSATSAI